MASPSQSPSPLVRITAALVVAAGLTGTARGAADAAPGRPAQPTAVSLAAEGSAACDMALSLVWVDGSRIAASILDDAAREASAIWAGAGISLTWAHNGPGRPMRPEDILVMVRDRLAGHPHERLRAGRRRTLGRIIRVSEDRPGRVIEVALPAIVEAIQGESLFNERIATLPAVVRDRILGRAVGRVAAHEIGHWLFGRGHAPSGLMRASIARRDLVSLLPPSLPDAWPSQARAQLRARRPCPAPDAVRQPVTE
jgi:hypothetical protein